MFVAPELPTLSGQLGRRAFEASRPSAPAGRRGPELPTLSGQPGRRAFEASRPSAPVGRRGPELPTLSRPLDGVSFPFALHSGLEKLAFARDERTSRAFLRLAHPSTRIIRA